MIKPTKLSLLLGLLLLMAMSAQAARRIKPKSAEPVVAVMPVYDTVRVVVYDTVCVEPKPAPRIDTLRLSHSPAEIDSLADVWQQLMSAQADKQFFGQFSEATDGEPEMAPDSLYRKRLMDMVSPVHLPYNYIVRKYIDQYLGGRWSPLSRVLSLSKYYFPIIEQELIAAGLPVELRFLPIIESNLSSVATSRAGAVGLWQFMPSTGKNLGLEINSLVDERCDVLLSTRAACRFLRDLYRIYDDWTLALAAYNCGPGNVSKAIARAGADCKTFWDIYDFLPSETRGYVPKFIAAAYCYTYHNLHNVTAASTPECIATDTIIIDRTMHLGQVASTLNIPLETLRHLNPQYKIDIVPAARKPYALRLPARYVAEFVENRDSIYAKDSLYLKEYMNPANLEKKRAEGVGYTYTVRSGDNLGLIAKRNRTTVKAIMQWNHLRSTVIRPGQKLRINKPKPRA
ncbi:MAG: transglycosylase SLT domain-containing protein [Alistipes sp.]|nr:transglycosylase SLT domain-containing protein [Alistipes sp.]